MSPLEFVRAIRKVIFEGTAKAIVAEVTSSPGRRPSPELVELSSWYRSLPSEDQANVNKMVRWTAELAAFQVLCVLDGVVAIEGKGDKGRLELTYIKDKQRIVLNEPISEFLHEVYKGEKA
jgi:hypothetical protein